MSEVAAWYLKPKLASWANQMWARFGGCPVYLVGSALTRSDPRDVDISIVLPDHVFAARYGVRLADRARDPEKDEHGAAIVDAQGRVPSLVDDYRDAMIGPEWSEGMKRCYREAAGLTRRLHPWLNEPIDLHIMPEGHAQTHHGSKARLRLDSMEDA